MSPEQAMTTIKKKKQIAPVFDLLYRSLLYSTCPRQKHPLSMTVIMNLTFNHPLSHCMNSAHVFLTIVEMCDHTPMCCNIDVSKENIYDDGVTIVFQAQL